MSNTIKIEKAQNIHAKDLTELTINSKSYWSYSLDQITQWKDVLYAKYLIIYMHLASL